MQVTMAELNKNVNAIINRARSSGETVVVLKHGKPIAEISPIHSRAHVGEALRYLNAINPVTVPESIDSVIDKGRKHGI